MSSAVDSSSETTNNSQTDLPKVEASTVPTSQLETGLAERKSENPEFEPSSQVSDISSQYVISPEELENLRAIDAVTQLRLFRFDNVSIREACVFFPELHKNVIYLPSPRIVVRVLEVANLWYLLG